MSFITGVDKRVYARVVSSPDRRFHLISKQFQFSLSAELGPEGLQLSKDTPAARFVKAAANSELQYEASSVGTPTPVTIETYSDPAFGIEDKSGLGSSAAVTAAVVGALWQYYRGNLQSNLNTVFKMAAWAHSQAQGGKVGSGFDIAASVFGASSYVRFSPEILSGKYPEMIDKSAWDYQLDKIPLPKGARVVLANIEGQQASTSAMIAKVNAWKEKEPSQYRALLNKLEGANRKAVASLKVLNGGDDAKLLSEFQQAFEHGRRLTRELGQRSGANIEPPELEALVDAALKHGAWVAKLPGAGGGDSVAAICLDVKDQEKLRTFFSSYKPVVVRVLDIATSEEGLRIESTNRWPLGPLA